MEFTASMLQSEIAARASLSPVPAPTTCSGTVQGVTCAGKCPSSLLAERQLDVSTAFTSAPFLLALVIGVVGGVLCVLKPEAIRAFAARYHPHTAERFPDAKTHRRLEPNSRATLASFLTPTVS
jgi:hypothetical protein